MKHLLSTLILVLSVGFASAQTEQRPTSDKVQDHKSCPMPDVETVSQNLDLSEEQLVRLRQINAECARECAAAGEHNMEVVKRNKERVREVLEPEQFERYESLLSEQKATKKEERR